MKTPEDFYNEFECNKKSEIIQAIKAYGDYMIENAIDIVCTDSSEGLKLNLLNDLKYND
jgi:hypothetical protein